MLDIGGGVRLADEEIILILKKETLLSNRDNRRFIHNATGGDEVINASSAKRIKAYVVAISGGRTRVYSTSTAPSTLFKRSAQEGILSMN